MGRKPKSNSLISNLKFYRQNSGFTQQQVADALHIERTTCKTLPNLITLKKLAQIYHVSVDDLMPMEPEYRMRCAIPIFLLFKGTKTLSRPQ